MRYNNEEEKSKAIKLRTENFLSLSQISKEVGLSVATLSVLLRAYPLTKQRINELKLPAQKLAAKANKDKSILRKNKFKNEGMVLVNEDPLFRDLCFLYWGEGTKFKSNTRFSICNCDPYMVKYIYKVIFHLGYINSMVTTAYCYTDSNNTEIINYWNDFIQSPINIYKVKNSIASKLLNTHKQPYGTLRIDVNSVELYNKVLGGIEAIKILAG
jgi:hypothetical protein